jgi:hypothetical protein
MTINGEHPEVEPLELRIWEFADRPIPQADLAFAGVKAAFWKNPNKVQRTGRREWLDVKADRISHRATRYLDSNPGVLRRHREAHPKDEYDLSLDSKMQECTPQFNLRNVMRLDMEVDLDWIEWTRHVFADRKAHQSDLDWVRGYRHESPEFYVDDYASGAVSKHQAEYRAVFRENDWEKWYGEDKKRLHGALWRYVPEDGGKRTRPWPEIKLKPNIYWKGRMITQEY